MKSVNPTIQKTAVDSKIAVIQFKDESVRYSVPEGKGKTGDFKINDPGFIKIQRINIRIVGLQTN